MMPLGSQAFCQAVDTGAQRRDCAPDRACAQIGSGAAGEIAQGALVGNRHAASAQADPLLAAPCLQMLVDGLAREAAELRELLLRDRELRAAGRFPPVQGCETQQAFREPRGCGEQR